MSVSTRSTFYPTKTPSLHSAREVVGIVYRVSLNKTSPNPLTGHCRHSLKRQDPPNGPRTIGDRPQTVNRDLTKSDPTTY